MTRAALALALCLATPAWAPAWAEVTSFDILTRTPAAGGRSFGAAGAYEMLTARATIALDPADPHNAPIVDLGLAPRNAAGRVEAETDVTILRPQHPNGTLLFEVVNRGRKLLPGWLDDTDAAAGSRLASAEDAGTGFLLEQGFTLVWAGWQLDTARAYPDEPPVVRIDVPVIPGVTGRVRQEFQLDPRLRRGFMGPDKAIPADSRLSAKFTFNDSQRIELSYPVASRPDAQLTVRTSADAPESTPPDLTIEIGPGVSENDATVQGINGGWDGPGALVTPQYKPSKGALYTLTYTATDPRVAGMGLAAIRDVTAFLRHDSSSKNPLADAPPTRAIALGISQSGRVLRDVLYFGMNQDEAGRQVFDGMMPVIPGARRSFTNARFAQPGRNPGPQFDRLYPVLQFPFTYPTLDDPVSGAHDGILQRCQASNTCPRLMHIDSEFEFWGSQASLVTTDPAGNPVAMPDNVRLYLFTGTPHGNLWNAVATTRADCALPLNPNSDAPTLRALLVAMQRWVTEDVAPPPSRYPSRADGTLVTPAEAYAPGTALPYRQQVTQAAFVEQTETGPVIRGNYPLFVPRTGPDGNAVAGVRLPIVAAPRATYTGWNPVAGADGPQDLCTQMGGVVPLPATPTPGDSRPALSQLYPTPGAYAAAVGAAAHDLVAARLLLAPDAAAMQRAAADGTLAKLAP